MKMGYLLEKTCSSYYPAYRSMVQSIEDALVEARDIMYVHTCVMLKLYWLHWPT